MTDRILDFSESQAYLRVKDQQLIIERKDAEPVLTPLCEIAAIIAAHPQVSCSQPMLAELMRCGGSFIVCDERHLPIGMMLPLQSNTLQTERMAAQMAAPLPLRKILWKQIVRRKVLAQADLLKKVRGNDWGLSEIAKGVRSGDTSNREAVASRRYWTALFDDPDFRRDREQPDQNRLLNYGYTVLRAVMGRAICAAGLHPSLGLHHHHRNNAFCLADDLMEPYRPLIDGAVVAHMSTRGDSELNRESKQALLQAILGRYDADGELRTLFDLCARTAVSLAKTYQKQSDRLDYPKNLSDAGA